MSNDKGHFDIDNKKSNINDLETSKIISIHNVSKISKTNNTNILSKNNINAKNTSFLSAINNNSYYNKSIPNDLYNSEISKADNYLNLKDYCSNSNVLNNSNTLKQDTNSIKNIDNIKSKNNCIYKSTYNINDIIKNVLHDNRISNISNNIDQNGSYVIDLPGHDIYLTHLEINNSIVFKGTNGSAIIVEEGPIIVNLNNIKEGDNKQIESDIDSNKKNIVRFEQVDIIFKPKIANSLINNSEDVIFYLFKLYPESILEIEMCNIRVDRKNISEFNNYSKCICFQVISNNNIYKNTAIFNNEDSKALLSSNNSLFNHKTTILKLSSSKISKFNQTIRACEGSIIDIHNCLIEYNINKAITLIDPKIVKIINTTFEMNLNNIIHIKYANDYYSSISIKKTIKFNNNQNIKIKKSKVYIESSSFQKNYGCALIIEKSFSNVVPYSSNSESFNCFYNLDIIINNCKFIKNKLGCIQLKDINPKKLRIENSLFTNNGDSAIMIKLIKCCTFFNNSDNYKHNNVIKQNFIHLIKGNSFYENEGYGIIMYSLYAILLNNMFNKNKSGGILLSGINIVNSNWAVDNTCKNINRMKENNNNNNTNYQLSNFVMNKCNFIKNGGSGIKLINCKMYVYIANSIIQENIEYGIYIDNQSSIACLPEKLSKLKGWSEKIANIDISKYMQGIFNLNETDNVNSNSFTPNTDISANNKKIINDCHVVLHNTNLLLNLRSGLFCNNSFILLKNCLINDNIQFAIEIFEEIQKKLILFDSFSKNNVNGSLGGNWGEISLTNKINCNNCFGLFNTNKNNNNSYNNLYIINNFKVKKDNSRSNENSSDSKNSSNITSKKKEKQ